MIIELSCKNHEYVSAFRIIKQIRKELISNYIYLFMIYFSIIMKEMEENVIFILREKKEKE